MKTARNKTVTRKRAARKPAGKQRAAKKAPAARTAAARRAAPQREGAGSLVVDATNVICGPQCGTRLDLLLSLVVAEAGRGRDVLCIFDATTPHRLQSSPERDLYRWLLQRKPRHFVQCPGRTQADALILAEAERMHCAVVSNDFFRDCEQRHPWVRDQGRVLRHQPIRDVLYLGDVAVRIETDLALLRQQIDRLFP